MKGLCLKGLLCSSAYHNAATLHSVFYKVLCIEPSVSVIQFTIGYLFPGTCYVQGDGFTQRFSSSLAAKSALIC